MFSIFGVACEVQQVSVRTSSAGSPTNDSHARGDLVALLGFWAFTFRSLEIVNVDGHMCAAGSGRKANSSPWARASDQWKK